MPEPSLIPPGHGEEPGPPRPAARCPTCACLIDAHPASRKDGRWEGWCQDHGVVVADYWSYEEIAEGQPGGLHRLGGAA